MRKFLFYLIAASFGIIVVASCKAKEHCPGYGQKTEAAKAVQI